MDGRRIVVEWEPSGGVFGFLLDRALPVERSPWTNRRRPRHRRRRLRRHPVRRSTTSIASRPDPLALPAIAAASSPWASDPGATPQPAAAGDAQLSEEVPFDERWRCYYVRAVRGTGAQRVESASSSRACMVPVDTEPPAKVTNLLATPEEGRIVLRWDPTVRKICAATSSCAARPVMTHCSSSPHRRSKTGFTDDTVMPGQMYTYVVHAVDNWIPVPNVSDRPMTVTREKHFEATP